MKVPLSIPGRISVYRTKILSLLAIGSNEADPLRDFFVEHEIAHPEGLSSPITNIKVDMPQPHSAPCTT
jgi:predicted Zn-dependent protease with MMP-like domain